MSGAFKKMKNNFDYTLVSADLCFSQRTSFKSKTTLQHQQRKW